MVGDNADINAITEELDLQPTKTRKKSEWPRASILVGLAQDTWSLQTEKEESKAVSVQMDKLQGVLLPKVDIIKKLSRKYSLETSVTVVIEMETGDGPEMVLSKKIYNFYPQLMQKLLLTCILIKFGLYFQTFEFP